MECKANVTTLLVTLFIITAVSCQVSHASEHDGWVHDMTIRVAGEMIRDLYDQNFTNVVIISNPDAGQSDTEQYETQETFLYAQNILLTVAKIDIK